MLTKNILALITVISAGLFAGTAAHATGIEKKNPYKAKQEMKKSEIKPARSKKANQNNSTSTTTQPSQQ